jgi:2-keto-4-pentenoate hydratase/2-oxohepta-3-ene-1,7-dioic acid hydratase in catechol pathway
VLGSGTFGGGCGLDLDKWLKPGQVVTLTIDGLGTLTNTVGTKKVATSTVGTNAVGKP